MFHGALLLAAALFSILAASGRMAFAQDSGLFRLPPVDVTLPGTPLDINAIADINATAEEIPPALEEGLTPDTEFRWFDAHYWFPEATWEGSFELGLNGSEGNSPTMNFRTGGSLKRINDLNEFSVDINYAKSTAKAVETQNRAIMNMNYDRRFAESRWTMFARYGLVYDEFKAFNLRWNVNMGLGRMLIESDATTLKARFGAGVSREIGGPVDRYEPEAVYGIDFSHQLTKRQKLVAKIDYFPQWDNFNDSRLMTDVGLEILLDEEAHLNLKIGLIDRYDSTPHGRRPNDFDYSFVLLWKP